jgi:hypothetical protein
LVSDLLREQLSDDLTPAQYQELDEALKKLEAGELAGPVDPPSTRSLRPTTGPTSSRGSSTILPRISRR